MPRQPPAAARRRAQDDRDTVMSEKPRRATIKDVAAAAGVATSTVSHTFSGHRAISSSTRERVMAAARELGYHPNPQAKSMRTGTTGMIGLILRPYLIRSGSLEAHETFNRVAGAIAVACLRQGLGLVHIPVRDDAPLEMRPMDGCILAYPVAHDPLIDDLISRQVPLVCADPDPARPDVCPWVGVDHESGIRQVLRTLSVTAGGDVWLLIGTEHNAWTLASEQVTEEWAQRTGVTLHIHRAPQDFRAAEARARVQELLRWNRPPQAVVYGRSDLTEAMVSAVSEAGLRVPQDVQLAALTDSAHARIPARAITALDLGQEALADAAVAQMLRVLEAPEFPPEPIVVSPQLRVRGSTRVEPWAAP